MKRSGYLFELFGVSRHETLEASGLLLVASLARPLLRLHGALARFGLALLVRGGASGGRGGAGSAPRWRRRGGGGGERRPRRLDGDAGHLARRRARRRRGHRRHRRVAVVGQALGLVPRRVRQRPLAAARGDAVLMRHRHVRLLVAVLFLTLLEALQVEQLLFNVRVQVLLFQRLADGLLDKVRRHHELVGFFRTVGRRRRRFLRRTRFWRRKDETP